MMFPASFAYFAPRSLDEALQLLTRHSEDAKVLAGGHSLLPAMKLRLSEPACLIDIGQLPDLKGISREGDELVIGALTVHADVAASELVRQHVPGLADAAEVIGDVQVRNRGTIGGSVAHADPGADFPVILTALGASFAMVGPSGSRTVAADDFFEDFFATALAPDELLTEVRVPISPVGSGTAYVKLPHPASGYVVVSAGALLVRATDGTVASARVAIGGVAGAPHRATATEAALHGKALSPDSIASAAVLAGEGTDPDGDVYASGEYRRHLATVYARRALQVAVQRIGA